MSLLRVTGGVRLQGSVAISGSKNAALAAMAAALLTDQALDLRNAPEVEDLDTMADMLRHLGVDVSRCGQGAWRLDAAGLHDGDVGAAVTQRMRASLLLLGPMVARTGRVAIARPGGDDIGMRRVEQHLEGLRLMGAEVREEGDAYVAHARKLTGARIDLDMPTVTGTENLMMAATLAEGITVITNAAREPQVVDLARCLLTMGARVSGAGSDQIVIEGNGGLLHSATHSVTPDHIEAATYLIAGAATGGDVVVGRMRPSDCDWLVSKLRAAGCEVVVAAGSIRVRRQHPLQAVDVTTWPHPGFATDCQSLWVALMTVAEGTSIISESIFENRFHHVEELRRLGARVEVHGRSAVVHGPNALRASSLRVPDIRSGAALVVAALCAEGTSVLRDIYHVDRGYHAFDATLTGLGAALERVPDAADLGLRDYSGVIGD